MRSFLTKAKKNPQKQKHNNNNNKTPQTTTTTTITTTSTTTTTTSTTTTNNDNNQQLVIARYLALVYTFDCLCKISLVQSSYTVLCMSNLWVHSVRTFVTVLCMESVFLSCEMLQHSLWMVIEILFKIRFNSFLTLTGKVSVMISTFLVHVILSSQKRPSRWPNGKASASRAEDPGFESRLRRDFFGVESYQ